MIGSPPTPDNLNHDCALRKKLEILAILSKVFNVGRN